MIKNENNFLTIQPNNMNIMGQLGSLDHAFIDLRVNYLGSVQIKTVNQTKTMPAHCTLRVVTIPSKWSTSKKTIIHELNYFNGMECQQDAIGVNNIMRSQTEKREND